MKIFSCLKDQFVRCGVPTATGGRLVIRGRGDQEKTDTELELPGSQFIGTGPTPAQLRVPDVVAWPLVAFAGVRCEPRARD